MIKILKYFMLLSAVLFISACSHTQPAPAAAENDELSWKNRQAELNQIKTWNLQGAIAIKTADNKGNTASVNWIQRANDYTMYFFGPLGMGKVQLDGNAQLVTLKQGKKTYSANTVEALLEPRLGWYLPVSNLYYWIRGIPAPGISAKTTFDEYNHLSNLQQDGWEIVYQRYSAANGIDLPTKMTMTYAKFNVKLVISQWLLSENTNEN